MIWKPNKRTYLYLWMTMRHPMSTKGLCQVSSAQGPWPYILLVVFTGKANDAYSVYRLSLKEDVCPWPTSHGPWLRQALLCPWMVRKEQLETDKPNHKKQVYSFPIFMKRRKYMIMFMRFMVAWVDLPQHRYANKL